MQTMRRQRWGWEEGGEEELLEEEAVGVVAKVGEVAEAVAVGQEEDEVDELREDWEELVLGVEETMQEAICGTTQGAVLLKMLQ